MMVSPSAKAAATDRTGYSSIIDGARSAGTVTPLSVGRAHAQVGHILAAGIARVQHFDIGRPFPAASAKGRCGSGSSAH
jgi:hypothetical protein